MEIQSCMHETQIWASGAKKMKAQVGCGNAMEEMRVAGSAAGLQRAHNEIVTQEVVSGHSPLM